MFLYILSEGLSLKTFYYLISGATAQSVLPFNQSLTSIIGSGPRNGQLDFSLAKASAS
jgi:hypothetical protein